MRLLNVSSLELKQFTDNQIPPYAILSHTWGYDEITFKDITENLPHAKSKSSFAKVQGTCAKAAHHGFEWVWIDSCCIDKSSSAELQEAINSMWNWYKAADICYAYLADLPDRKSGWGPTFRYSRWFTRGWTLQELIAPWSVEFYTADWSEVGTKLSRLDELQNITGITKRTLEDGDPGRERVAEVMSWAAHRDVTRAEDLAYCLMGLFDINMPMLYGEGGKKAFLRLQDEIFKGRPDYSMFLYTYAASNLSGFAISLLADTPTQFCRRLNCTNCFPLKDPVFPQAISYSGLQDCVLPSSQTGTTNELFIRRDGQELSLTTINHGSVDFHIHDSVVKLQPGTTPSSTLAILPITDNSNFYFALPLVKADNSFWRLRRPIQHYSAVSDLPEPTRILIHSCKDRSNPFSAMSVIELKSSMFIIENLETDNQLSPQWYLFDSHKSEIYHAVGPSRWECELVLRNAAEGLCVRLSIVSSKGAPQDCRITQVEVKWPLTLGFIKCTPDGWSSDRFESASNSHRLIVSLRRLPKGDWGDYKDKKVLYVYRNQLEIESIVERNVC